MPAIPEVGRLVSEVKSCSWRSSRCCCSSILPCCMMTSLVSCLTVASKVSMRWSNDVSVGGEEGDDDGATAALANDTTGTEMVVVEPGLVVDADAAAAAAVEVVVAAAAAAARSKASGVEPLRRDLDLDDEEEDEEEEEEDDGLSGSVGVVDDGLVISSRSASVTETRIGPVLRRRSRRVAAVAGRASRAEAEGRLEDLDFDDDDDDDEGDVEEAPGSVAMLRKDEGGPRDVSG